jgi:cytochrome c-type biogenesis protein CcmF
MANIGQAAVLLALFLSLYACLAALFGRHYGSLPLLVSARNAAVAGAVLLTAAVAVLEILLLKDDFSILYVAQVSSTKQPPLFKITALWGGQAGSLLLWAWFMSLFSAAAVVYFWERLPRYVPHLIAVTQATLAFFVSLSSGLWELLAQPLLVLGGGDMALRFAEMADLDPFRPLGFLAVDGAGMNPLLRHPGMVMHPPLLYLGYVGFVVPFALVTAALAQGNVSGVWLRAARRWVLLSWLFLSLGLLLGMWWAYGVLGWGGYWGWDPVENAALMPWLTATAFVHSAVVQERRGMFKGWNVALLVLTYVLVLFGAFITRSGVVDSVHAFALSGVGPLLLLFLSLNLFYGLYLLLSRLDQMEGENQLRALLSRESLFLLNNVLFLAVAFVTFWGTIFPVVSEAFSGQKAIVGPPFFNRVNGPLLGLLVVLMGVAPLAPWRVGMEKKSAWQLLVPGGMALGAAGLLYALGVRDVASLPAVQLKLLPVALLLGVVVFSGGLIVQEFWQRLRHRTGASRAGWAAALGALFRHNQRRYGGYMVHLGIVLMALAVIGTNFLAVERQVSLGQGESLRIDSPLAGSYVLTYTGLEQSVTQEGVERATAVMQVEHNGRLVGALRPGRDWYVSQDQVMTAPAVRHTLGADLYVVVAGWDDAGARVVIKAYIEPLVNWLWIGGLVFVLGTVLALWPHSREGVEEARQQDELSHAVTAAEGES